MQDKASTSITAGPIWGSVLIALCKTKRFTSLEELAKLCEQDEPDVMNALTFLHNQEWVQCSADGSQWMCTSVARAVIEKMEQSPARMFPWIS